MNEVIGNIVAFLENHDLLILLALFLVFGLARLIHVIRKNSKKVNLAISNLENRPNRKITKDFWEDHFICVECLGDCLLEDRDESERSFRALEVVHGVCKKCSSILKQDKQ